MVLGEPWSITAEVIVPVGVAEEDNWKPPYTEEVMFDHVAPPAVCKGFEEELSYPYAVDNRSKRPL